MKSCGQCGYSERPPEIRVVHPALLRKTILLVLVNPFGPDSLVEARKDSPLHDAIVLYVGEWWTFRHAREQGVSGMVVRNASGKPLATGLTVENLGLEDGSRLFPEPDGPMEM